MGAHFFFFSFLTQVEGCSHLEIMASFSNDGSNSMGDNSSVTKKEGAKPKQTP